jgi:hypothetical protein
MRVYINTHAPLHIRNSVYPRQQKLAPSNYQLSFVYRLYVCVCIDTHKQNHSTSSCSHVYSCTSRGVRALTHEALHQRCRGVGFLFLHPRGEAPFLMTLGKRRERGRQVAHVLHIHMLCDYGECAFVYTLVDENERRRWLMRGDVGWWEETLVDERRRWLMRGDVGWWEEAASRVCQANDNVYAPMLFGTICVVPTQPFKLWNAACHTYPCTYTCTFDAAMVNMCKSTIWWLHGHSWLI